MQNRSNESPKLKNTPISNPNSNFKLKEMIGGFEDVY